VKACQVISHKRLRQQTLKWPPMLRQAQYNACLSLSPIPPAKRLDVSIKLDNRPRYHARMDNVPKVRVDEDCRLKKAFGTVSH